MISNDAMSTSSMRMDDSIKKSESVDYMASSHFPTPELVQPDLRMDPNISRQFLSGTFSSFAKSSKSTGSTDSSLEQKLVKCLDKLGDWIEEKIAYFMDPSTSMASSDDPLYYLLLAKALHDTLNWLTLSSFSLSEVALFCMTLGSGAITSLLFIEKKKPLAMAEVSKVVNRFDLERIPLRKVAMSLAILLSSSASQTVALAFFLQFLFLAVFAQLHFGLSTALLGVQCFLSVPSPIFSSDFIKLFLVYYLASLIGLKIIRNFKD